MKKVDNLLLEYQLMLEYKRAKELILIENFINSISESIEFEYDKTVNITIGDIYAIFKNNNYDETKFEEYLRIKLNMYSNFYIKNLIKQINIIYYFSII